MTGELGDRKSDHLELCAREEVGFRRASTLLEEVRLLHDSLPELAVDEIDLRARVFGKVLRAPIVIASMTGGTEQARKVNVELAAIAEARGYGFGLGSQRAMMKRAEAAPTYRVREVAPTTLLLANLGGVQAAKTETAEVEALVRAVGADALCVHLNPAQEVVQPEGDRDFRGVAEAMGRLSRELPFPVLAKETGCGIGPAAARKLRAVGVRHVDVSGAGGTSWVGVETRRAAGRDETKRALGEALWDWGVPTAVSTAVCASAGFSTVIATGGVATGLDVARAIALGATAAGIARPVLKALYAGGREAAERFLDGVEAELRAVMLLVGAGDLAALSATPRVLGPELARWLAACGVQR
jgi:isopentenyl-diphosphate delta-isomerase